MKSAHLFLIDRLDRKLVQEASIQHCWTLIELIRRDVGLTKAQEAHLVTKVIPLLKEENLLTTATWINSLAGQPNE